MLVPYCVHRKVESLCNWSSCSVECILHIKVCEHTIDRFDLYFADISKHIFSGIELPKITGDNWQHAVTKLIVADVPMIESEILKRSGISHHGIKNFSG